MARALAGCGAGERFTLEIVDVDADDALVARYDELVPVLVRDGAEICHYHLDGDALERALA